MSLRLSVILEIFMSLTPLPLPKLIPFWLAKRLLPDCSPIMPAPSRQQSSARMSAMCLTEPMLIPFCEANWLVPVCKPRIPCPLLSMSSILISLTCRTPPNDMPFCVANLLVPVKRNVLIPIWWLSALHPTLVYRELPSQWGTRA